MAGFVSIMSNHAYLKILEIGDPQDFLGEVAM